MRSERTAGTTRMPPMAFWSTLRCVRKRKAAWTLMEAEASGRVTKKGLEQPVGAAAINKMPRTMIREAVEDVADAFGYAGGFSVVISIPGGEEVAKKTFNPRLGIIGGISVLGTSGIVVPMSEDALIASIHAEMHLPKKRRQSIFLSHLETMGRLLSKHLSGRGRGKFRQMQQLCGGDSGLRGESRH